MSASDSTSSHESSSIHAPVMELSSPVVETGAQAESAPGYARTDGLAQAIWPKRSSPGWRDALRRRMLACADVAAALCASLSMVFAGNGQAAQFTWALAFIPVWILVAKLLGLYDRDQRALRHLTVDEISALVLWALIGTSGLTLFLELTPAGRPSSSSGVIAGATVAVSVILLRASARWLWRATVPPERVVIIGTVSAADAFRRKLELFPAVHATIVAVHDPRDIDEIGRDPVALATIDRLFFAPASLDDRHVRAVLEIARAAGLKLSLIPPFPSAFGTGVRLNHLAELPLLEYSTSDLSRSTLLLKRVYDVAVTAVALVVLAPLMALIAIIIKLDSRGPVFFRQWRIGQRGRTFTIFKFRSMTADAEARKDAVRHLSRHGQYGCDSRMFKIDADPRVTRVGGFLRRTSLDELPQLLNVIRGEMSLVGPRPLVPEESSHARGWASRRLDLRPGMTGPWQVNGASAIEFEEMVRLDYAYVASCSLRTDIGLLVRTIPVVWGGRNRG